MPQTDGQSPVPGTSDGGDVDVVNQRDRGRATEQAQTVRVAVDEPIVDPVHGINLFDIASFWKHLEHKQKGEGDLIFLIHV